MNTILIYTLERENLEFGKPPGKILEFIDFWWKLGIFNPPGKNF